MRELTSFETVQTTGAALSYANVAQNAARGACCHFLGVFALLSVATAKNLMSNQTALMLSGAVGLGYAAIYTGTTFYLDYHHVDTRRPKRR